MRTCSNSTTIQGYKLNIRKTDLYVKENEKYFKLVSGRKPNSEEKHHKSLKKHEPIYRNNDNEKELVTPNFLFESQTTTETCDINPWATAEVLRQYPGQTKEELKDHIVDMKLAWKEAAATPKIGLMPENGLSYFVRPIAKLVEPERPYGWRKTPVTFGNGNTAQNAATIERSMNLLNEAAEANLLTPDEIVYEFLKIHPFEDGNGRTASILYNYLQNTLHNPDPLPNYFGEN